MKRASTTMLLVTALLGAFGQASEPLVVDLWPDKAPGDVGIDNSAVIYVALQRAGVPVELHIFANGNHDFGVRRDTKLAASWMELCVKWLRNYQFLRD